MKTLRRLIDLWQWLTEPAPAIQNLEERRQARLLSSLLIPLIPLPVLILVVRMLADPVFQPSWITIGGFLVLATAYGLSRTRLYPWGAAIAIGIFPASIFSLAASYSDPSELRSLLTYLVLGILLSSMLFSVRGTTLFAAINIAGVILLPLFISHVTFPTIIPPLAYLILTSALIIVAMRHRELLENDRQSELIASEEQVRRLNAELEQRVAARTAELQTANQELEAFSYSVSHDLRAPLRGIDGYTGILLEDYAERLGPEGRSLLSHIRSASQRMSQIINDLLKLSGLTRAEMRLEGVDLSKLVQEVADELRQAQPERQVEFVVAEGVWAYGDEHLLRSVLENLIGNAWKFTAGHSSARIEFGVSDEYPHPCFFVRDDGAGFDMAYSGQLFTAFRRLHHEEEFSGTGIGLATVKRIIRQHGGRVWAEGAVEQGATFYFTLPEHEESTGEI